MTGFPKWINWLLAILAVGGISWAVAALLNMPAQEQPNLNNLLNGVDIFNNSTADKKELCSTEDYQTELVKLYQGSFANWIESNPNLLDPEERSDFKNMQITQLNHSSYVKLGRAIAWENCNADRFFSDAAIDDPKVNYHLLSNINHPLCTLWTAYDSPNLNNVTYAFLYQDPDVPGNVKTKTYSAISTLEGLTCLESLSISSAINSVFPAIVFPYSRPVYSYNITFDLGSLNQLKNLISLDISQIYIPDLQPISKLSNLEYLYMRGTKTRKVSQFDLLEDSPNSQLTHYLSSLKKLKILDLSESEAGNLTFLNSLLDLRYLSVAKTYTQTLDGIQNLKELRGLDVSDTTIDAIAQITNLSKLTYLNIANTRIKHFTVLSKLNKLSELNISGLKTAFTLDVFASNITILRNIESLKKITATNALSSANCRELQRLLPGKQVIC